MKKIAVVTSTRAEYGLLAPVIKELRKQESENLKVDLIVTGTHLSERYGYTINEINADGIRIDHVIPTSVNSDSEIDISTNQAEVLIKFSDLFLQERYSAIMILGDRYEIFAVAIAAGNTRTPIFHLCGGDTTEGATDEWIRHSITKISYIRFVTNEISRKRVIQLGEDPDRVFNFGSTSVDNILSLANMSKIEALRSIGLEECKYAICTYHPVTLDGDSVDDKINSFLEAIKKYPEIQFIVTKSNADLKGNRINDLLDKAALEIDNLHLYSSLGAKRYLSIMKYAEFVLGNSSSGIIEAPVFKIPTINIGDRQKGRLQSPSVINCNSDAYEIEKAIDVALSDIHKKACSKVVSPYGEGHSADRIAQKAIDIIFNERIELKKKFFDL